MNQIIKRMLPFAIALSMLIPNLGAIATTSDIYTIKAGRNIYDVCNINNMRTTQIKVYNWFDTSNILANQKIFTFPNVKYTVVSGDTLSLIANKYGTTVDRLKSINNLSSDYISTGKILTLPIMTPQPVLYWPSVTYKVKTGETMSSIAKKFNTTMDTLLKYNYMKITEWVNEGEKVAINGYAPRYYAAMPKESPTKNFKKGKLVDWFFDGKYLIRRNSTFVVTDIATGKHIKFKMMGGVNHSDVEPMTTNDTAIMKKLWPKYNWDPRPVVIHIRGMNIAGSLSGMPHSFDTISNNGVTGHFDLYLYGSKSHNGLSKSYVNQHRLAVLKAAGIK